MRAAIFGSTLAALGIFITSGDGRAFPLETADLLSGGSESHVRPAGTANPFTVDGGLKKNFDFWVRIYTQYYTYQGVIHDAKYIDHVYEVVDLRGPHSNRIIREAKKKWRHVLESVQQKVRGSEKNADISGKLNEDELKVYRMFADVDEPNKYVAAAHRKRLRWQLGQKDRFIEGLKDSGRYLPAMEAIFRREGLPVELTRLPFVESSFNVRARSKVGASGIWQFMRSTGRLFLRINDTIDERNDPIRATEAAAKLLKLNYESLKSWPLAVTAYNHGRQGMMRAVRNVGSEDLEEVISGYRSRRFGFASGNFFTELLAAIEAEKNAEKYFGKVERDPPLSAYEVEIPDYIDVREITRFLKINMSEVQELNPGLCERAFTDGKRAPAHVPAGYRLRLPLPAGAQGESAARIFLAGYSQIPAIYKHQRQGPWSYDTGVKTSKRRKRGR